MNRARRVAGLAIIAVVPLFLAGHGPWPLAVCAFWVGWSAFANRRAARSSAPEVWILTVTVVTQTVFAICALIDGGPTSPVMLWLVLPLITSHARYAARGVNISIAYTYACLALASLGRGLDAFLAAPQIPAVTFSAGIGVIAYARAMRSTEDHQRRAAVVDPLTGLRNRAALRVDFDKGWGRCAQRGLPMGLLVCDLDHFKAVNDRHGHHIGDAVLVEVATALRDGLPRGASVYRLGGEEFLVLLPGGDLDAVATLAAALRERVAAVRPADVAVTISIGGTSAIGDAADEAAMFRVADAALYEAKRAGRNRVVMRAPLVSTTSTPSSLAAA